jgi:hypothetical protein
MLCVIGVQYITRNFRPAGDLTVALGSGRFPTREFPGVKAC